MPCRDHNVLKKTTTQYHSYELSYLEDLVMTLPIICKLLFVNIAEKLWHGREPTSQIGLHGIFETSKSHIVQFLLVPFARPRCFTVY